MQQRSKSSQLGREIEEALHGSPHHTSRGSHATKADPRRQFLDAFYAMQHAFGQADEVVAHVYNAATRLARDLWDNTPKSPAREAAARHKKALAKLKTVTNRMEKALRDYSGEVDDLLGQLE